MKTKSKPTDAVKRPVYRFDVMPTVLCIEKNSLADCVATATKKDGFVVVTQNGKAVCEMKAAYVHNRLRDSKRRRRFCNEDSQN